MPTIPDSNVLLDLIYAQTKQAAWSRKWYSHFADLDGLVINAIIFSEATAKLDELESARALINSLGLTYEAIPVTAAFVAGKAHSLYRSKGGGRERTLPDFLIGAHAAARGYRILTRDAARYRTYFPGVDVIAPDTHP